MVASEGMLRQLQRPPGAGCSPGAVDRSSCKGEATLGKITEQNTLIGGFVASSHLATSTVSRWFGRSEVTVGEQWSFLCC
jgi:hypothetical protein